MGFFSILLIALGLSADCFAVALGGSIAMKGHSRLQVLRAAIAFGLFQALMPVLGWLVGQTIVDLIADYDHWVAFGLLAIVGGHMLWESFCHRDGRAERTDITRGWPLLVLSLATSIDALAVGLTFPFIEVNVWVASPTIGVVAFAATVVGFLLGRRVGRLVGRWAAAIGGLLLIAIGLRILLTHLF
jgi:putative Mn2+ efflux pump MntP